jgi:DNA adenine methylase
VKAPATLRAPFPWFGGKSKVAPVIWRRFGNVPNYVEPFAGSLAVLLARPHDPKIETVNDLDGFVPNFWRALQADPDAVARYADWPVSECDLHARHLWLTNEGRDHVERLKTDADYYDAKIAGWWVWGLCQWIGSGWCEHPEWKQLPHLGNAGRGVHRPSQKLPHLGDAGRGVHRPSQKLPHLGNAGRGVLYEYLRAIADRLRGVRVCCGDWSRVCGPTPTVKQGLTGVFLDPPYSQEERDGELYAIETPVAADVRAWCLENGNDSRMRIALCGYAGEGHEELEQSGWAVHEWKAKGGYGSQGNGTAGRENSKRERIWFSPHCLKDTRPKAAELFAESAP